MEDKKHNYTIRWRQVYNTWPSKQCLDEAVDSIVEEALKTSDYTESRSVIERVKQ